MVTAYERTLQRLAGDVADEAIVIAEIPAPTFREGARAEHVHDRLAAIGGWDDLSLDRMGNVVAIHEGPAAERGSGLLVAAHLDTVFADDETPATKRRGRIVGRGIGDNSVGVAGVIAVGEALRRERPRGLGRVILAASVGEEGRGDLGGVRQLCEHYAGAYDRVLAVEGLSLNRIQIGGVASRRYEVRVETDGGHSWGAYGRPNAISVAARAIASLDPLMPRVGVEPKTTMNVGVISGGRSVNTIAPDATFELDIRSIDSQALAELDRRARAAIRGAVTGDARVSLKRIGDRPGGSIGRDDPMIRAVERARRASGLGEPSYGFGSTDANIPLALGIPATCVGITTGGEAHTPREWMRTGPVRRGVPYLGRVIANVARLPV